MKKHGAIFLGLLVMLALMLNGPVAIAQKPLDLNTATEKDLEALKGVGPATAKKIIAGRPFQKPEDIMKVKGIKEGEFKKIKDIIVAK